MTSGLLAAARSKTSVGHDPARRIVERDHFRKLYERNPLDVEKNSDAARMIFQAAEKEFGSINLRFDQYPAKGGSHDFPVLFSDNRIVSSGAASSVLLKVPIIVADFIFIASDLRDKARTWLDSNRTSIIKAKKRKGNG